MDELPDDSRDAEALIRLSQQWRFFMDRIDDLKPDRRTVFVMAEIDEKPNAEISATLQIPVTAVESKLRDARQTLYAVVERARKTRTLPGIMWLGTAAAAEGAAPHPLLSLLRRAGRVLRASAVACLPGLVPMAAHSLPAESLEIQAEIAIAPVAAEVPSQAAPAGPSGAVPVPPVASRSNGTDERGVPAQAGIMGPGAAPGRASLSYATRTFGAASHHQGEPPALMVLPAERAPAPSIPPADQVHRELFLVDGARNTLNSGNIDLALAELERHKKRYPDGYVSHVRDELLAQIRQVTGKDLQSAARRSRRASVP